METRRTGSTFELVPDAWLDPVVGLWVTLLAVAGTQLTYGLAADLLAPLAGDPWIALVLTVVVAVAGAAVFGFGLVRGYRRARGFEPRLVRDRLVSEPLARTERRWLGGLGVAGLLVMGLGGALSTLAGHGWSAAAPMLALASPQFFGDAFPLSLGLADVNAIVNGLPYTAFVALLAGAVLGPAAAALVHGVLQDTLARVGPPAVAVGATAVVATVALEPSAFISVTTVHEALNAVAAFGFVLAAAACYRRTENLLVVMAGYGLFNVLGVAVAWLSLAASLHAAGHLVG